MLGDVRVEQLIRSQFAGIVGNLALCGPLVLLGQALAWALAGQPLAQLRWGHKVLGVARNDAQAAESSRPFGFAGGQLRP